MSNLPPGVSGHEPQIAGYDERDVFREVEECLQVEALVLADLVIRRTWGGKPGTSNARPNVRVTARPVVCTFEGGTVPGLLVGDFRHGDEIPFLWDCPVCGTENETTVDADEFWEAEANHREDYL